ncbi:HEAT repeat domain-containing protein [Chlamydia ibidis]|uniref:HEAT repeat domain-containing protein n=1 Tax=Chlamydia ibidis TaxID=1405396 RepID=UPI00055559E0|nr:HEAT repeat domain-containing protein [Chlamydia ibidis]
MHQYLLIHDISNAVKEADRVLNSAEYSCDEARLALRALIQSKEYALWKESYTKASKRYPQLRYNRDILEDFALQVLADSISHPSITVRAVNVLAMGLAGDFRVSPLLVKMLSDDSALVRTLALQVVLRYGSEDLKEEVVRIACQDDFIHVRVVAYQIAALLGIEKLLPYLKERAHNSLVDGAERREAWKASCMLDRELMDQSNIYNDIDQALITCQMLHHEVNKRNEHIFLKLLSIESPEVQEAALLTALACGRDISCKSSDIAMKVRSLSQTSPFPKVRLQAAALLYLQGDSLGEKILEDGLRSPITSVMEAASAAVCSLGIQGVHIAEKYVSSVVSKKASANLAILLLVSRRSIEMAGDIIAKFILNPEMCWAIEHFLWEEQWDPKYEVLPLYSSMVKREISRKLIRLLAIAKYSKVKQVTADFLSGQQSRAWSFFSGVFWEEGEEEDVVVSISDQESFAVNLETALANLCKKRDQDSLEKAIALYPNSQWHDKLAILEAVAFSENIESIDFLLNCCQYETPSLRSAAAGAIFAIFK